MNINKQQPLLFTGTSHTQLAEKISQILSITLGLVKIERFPDNEVFVEVLENVEGAQVFILQSIALRPDRYLMELLVLVDALKRANTKTITAVIPYFGYCRQDCQGIKKVPVTAALVINLLKTAGVDHVLTIDLHSEQLKSFIDIPLDNLAASPALAKALGKSIKSESNELIVVAPDNGSVNLAKNYARELNAECAHIQKRRINATTTEVIAIIGDVKGKDVLLADDMCATGSTLLSAAKACQEKGAKSIHAVVTHGLFVQDAVEKIENSPIDALLVTDTVPINQKLNLSTKIKCVSVAPLLAHAIQCAFRKESILPFMNNEYAKV